MSTQSISYKRHRFSPEIITPAVWLYCRFNLNLREVEEMFLERGIDVSYETIRRWIVKFGPSTARGLRRRQPRPDDIWHLDEVVVKIFRRQVFWDQWQLKLRESSAHLVDCIMRRVVCDANVAFRVSFV